MATKIRHLSRPLDFPAAGDDYIAALNEAATGSPRTAAIVAAALVEDALRWCLCSFLIPAGAQQAELPAEEQAAVFDNETAPLKTFHAKIVIGYSLGIYGKVTRENLQRIKNIRNVFAHSPRAITFDTPEVAKECAELRYHFFSESRDVASMPVDKVINPCEHFLRVAKVLIFHLHAIGFQESEYAKTMEEML